MLKGKFFWWLLMILLLISVVWLASNNQGYVLIVRPPFRWQFSFNFLLILIVLSFLVLHYILRFVHYLRRLPAIRLSKKEAERLQASNDALLEGMHALAEGDFESAEVAVKHAHELIQNANHEKILAALALEKNKQGALLK
ncbi:MAG: heme biosynthesis protein HemY [Methylotenera sp.]|uniref:heme biosynthesis HemY N-terminal domain-containing protein n=1 Tax=Methylotenera sp. TaxID=2051956 RepID=UPI0018246B69|nr:heme biosynthesis HemY N-terminal domain-containing protein [Methylotenera sp.]NOU25303.1 heme biosynthesis protein HemY [Methylotenera sp.]